MTAFYDFTGQLHLQFFQALHGVHRVRMFLTVPAEGGEMSASD